MPETEPSPCMGYTHRTGYKLHGETMYRALLISCLAVLAACGRVDESAPTIEVFIGNGHTQCADDGMTLAETQMSLVEAGIDVLDGACGVLTGVAYPAVCGGPTGEINIHSIRPENLPDAQALGFRSVTDIGVSPDITATGYEEVDCAGYGFSPTPP